MISKRKARLFSVVVVVLCLTASSLFSAVLASPQGSGAAQKNGPGDMQDEGGSESHQQGSDTESGDGSGNQNQNQYGKNESCEGNGSALCFQHRFGFRNMSMSKNRSQTRICSQWQHQNGSSSFVVLFGVSDGPSISFELLPDSQSSKSELDFVLDFKRLVEYVDENNNGFFDEQDSVLSEYLLNVADFEDINYSTVESDDGQQLWVASVSTSDSVFSLILYVSGNNSEFEQIILRPSEVKFDVLISNFSFVNESSDIALEMNMSTTHSVSVQSQTDDEKKGFAKNEAALNISSGLYEAFFSWISSASVDGVTQEVNVSLSSSTVEVVSNDSKTVSKQTSVFFCYPQGQTIVHDPKVGVVEQSVESVVGLLHASTASVVSYVVACCVATVIFIGVVVLRRRV